MPHVDDGTLHALLDGALRAEEPARADVVEAHLETCPDCRALLARAADLRAEASGILAMAEPHARPDFQEVLARAGHATAGAAAAAGSTDAARRVRLRGQARATRGIAWAATIVLALGTGYLIRDLVDDDAVASDPVAMERATTETAATETADESVAGRGREADAAAPAPEAEQEPTLAPLATTETPTPAAPMPRTRPGDGDEAPLAGVDRVAVEDVAIPERALAEPAAGREPTAAEDRRELAAARSARAEASLETVVVTQAPRSAFVAPPAVPSDDWSPVTTAEAVTLMEGPVYVLPGAEVEGFFVRGAGHAAEVRSLQRLDEAVTLVVTQRRAGVTDAGDRPEADLAEEHAATVLRDGHWVTVAGALPAEALQALAAAANPIDSSEPPAPRR